MPYTRIKVKIKYKTTPGCQPPPIITSSIIAAEVARNICDHDTILLHEQAFILCLNNINTLLGWYPLAKGGMQSITIDPRIIATIAVHCIAQSIILIHNHPSGSLTPSPADISTTSDVKKILDIIRIPLLDHIIITQTEHFSMKENGLL